MRRIVLIVAALVALGGLAPVGSADASGHPGCGGIDQAFGKASPKGKAALTTVAERLGCGSIDPEPIDTIACPAGQSSLARWTYTGTWDGPEAHGWPTWQGSWTNTAGSGVDIPHGDGGGFYWVASEPGSVQSIVLQSFEVPGGDPQVVTVTPPKDPISQNEFEHRVGINLVNFCG